jgi:mannose-6-phosphate isomerase-like protein (cupin superfamily)
MNRLTIAVSIVLGLLAFGRLSASEVTIDSIATEQPLILASHQGEVRVWRPVVSESPADQKLDEATPFVIKVDRRHGGSPDLWFGTETLASGAGIPYHRHLHEDEILYIMSGSARVHVGSLVGDAGRGAIVFIPRNTWVSLQPNDKAPISLVFAFNAPGFDRYMRCESVPFGEHPQLVTAQEDQRCQKLGDVQYR